jgi:hypothetical protein
MNSLFGTRKNVETVLQHRCLVKKLFKSKENQMLVKKRITNIFEVAFKLIKVDF